MNRLFKFQIQPMVACSKITSYIWTEQTFCKENLNKTIKFHDFSTKIHFLLRNAPKFPTSRQRDSFYAVF